MPILSQKKPGSDTSRTNSNHWKGVEAEDIPQGWTDDMVKRLFDVLNREMIRLENEQMRLSDAKDHNGDPEPLNYEQAQERQKMLTRMRNDLERLRAMDMTVKARRPIVTVSDDEIRAQLQHEIARILAAERAAGDSSKSSS